MLQQLWFESLRLEVSFSYSGGCRRSLDVDDGGMEFPNSSELLRAALVVGILKGQANHLCLHGLGKVVAGSRNRYSIARQACNLVLPRRTILGVAGRLHHHAWRGRIRRLGHRHVDV